MEGHVIVPAEAIGDGAPLFAFGYTARVMQFDTKIHAEDDQMVNAKG